MENSFLGTGWAFPPEFDNKLGKTRMVSNVDDINQSLHILLSTSLGERVMQPDYGCNLQDYQFEPANNSLIGFLKDLIQRAILYYEPRIVVEKITITEPGSFDLIEGLLRISIDYVITSENSRYNYVYDFYLKEADRAI
ncbi:MAG: GPW/gp25 family protein [Saprospirales bacterium]|nr:GPW/gp25 family protein [Saprospirales bacterium]MBK8922855.1 GPW/gp25 family protein [Saprospirales bacterium]